MRLDIYDFLHYNEGTESEACSDGLAWARMPYALEYYPPVGTLPSQLGEGYYVQNGGAQWYDRMNERRGAGDESIGGLRCPPASIDDGSSRPLNTTRICRRALPETLFGYERPGAWAVRFNSEAQIKEYEKHPRPRSVGAPFTSSVAHKE